jgi:hypothetical protein
MHHIVIFEPKHESSRAELESLLVALKEICPDVSGLSSARIGRRAKLDVAYEENGRWTNLFIGMFEFESRSSLMAYLKHPLHERLGELFWKVCESTTIVDVEMQDVGVASVASLGPVERTD